MLGNTMRTVCMVGGTLGCAIGSKAKDTKAFRNFSVLFGMAGISRRASNTLSSVGGAGGSGARESFISISEALSFFGLFRLSDAS